MVKKIERQHFQCLLNLYFERIILVSQNGNIFSNCEKNKNIYLFRNKSFLSRPLETMSLNYASTIFLTKAKTIFINSNGENQNEAYGSY